MHAESTFSDRDFLPRGSRSLVVQILVMAVGYYVTGRLVEILSIPTGYASAVWPPAGLALAGALLVGNRIWPGIVIGAFFVNFVNMGIALDAIGTATILKPLGAAASIAFGAWLQAAIGAFLIRRFASYPNSFAQERDVFRFLVLGAPIACLVSAIWGVSSLVLAGLLDPARAPSQVWTWWVGDTIGVVIFTPLALMWATKSPVFPRRRRLQVSLPLLTMFAIIVAVFVYACKWEQRRLRVEFEQRTDRLAQAFKESIETQVDVLRSVQSCFASLPAVGRHEFHAFVSPLLARHSVIHALEWIPRVRHEDRAAFEAAARKDGVADFQIRERNAENQLVRASTRAEYFPVHHAEPLSLDRAALGFDLATDAALGPSLGKAGERAVAVATGRLALAEDDGPESGCLVFLPVYRPESSPGGPTRHGERLAGFVMGAVRLGELLDQVARGTADLRIRFYDRTSPEKSVLLCEYVPPNLGTDRGDPAGFSAEGGWGLRRTIPVNVAGRNWAMVFSVPQQYLLSRRPLEAWAMMAGGLLFVGLSGAFLLVVTGRAVKIEELVAERTRELRLANSALVRGEEQLRHAQKMEALGQLSGGIAHDFNNLNTVVLGYTNLILKRMRAEDPLRNKIEAIQAASRKGVQITRQLLAFSRRQMLRPRVLDLNAHLSKARNMIQLLVGENITITRKGEEAAAFVKVDPVCLDQVIMNLVINARDAMPSGGTLTLESGQVQADDGFREQHHGAAPGTYVFLRVADTGVGMTPEIRQHLFEPFFTTKGPLHGTGLGLSTAYGIVHQSGGFFDVQTAPDTGSTFTIFLPCITETTVDEPPAPEISVSLTGAGTVLVVEDDPLVRKMAAEALRECGYAVLEAADGRAALQVWRENRDAIHLIFTDVRMPVMGGTELATEIRKVDPGARILFCSGYAEEASPDRKLIDTAVNFLSKPYDVERLVEKVQFLLKKE